MKKCLKRLQKQLTYSHCLCCVGKVYHTYISTSSVSLRRSILHWPTFRSKATEWGIEKEEIARQAYLEIASRKHQSLTLSTTGLCVNPLYPHLGASPDALISCECCGEGIVEIKCPFSIRDQDPNTLRDTKKDFFLQHTVTGLRLSQKHNYYFQIQGQLAICDRAFCDFVCWTPEGIYTERVARDLKFFVKLKEKLDKCFKQVILPCILLGSEDISHHKEDYQAMCYCGKGEAGKMIAPMCSIEWFHFNCVGLETAPDGEWFCPDCKLLLRQ